MAAKVGGKIRKKKKARRLRKPTTPKRRAGRLNPGTRRYRPAYSAYRRPWRQVTVTATTTTSTTTSLVGFWIETDTLGDITINNDIELGDFTLQGVDRESANRMLLHPDQGSSFWDGDWTFRARFLENNWATTPGLAQTKFLVVSGGQGHGGGAAGSISDFDAVALAHWYVSGNTLPYFQLSEFNSLGGSSNPVKSITAPVSYQGQTLYVRFYKVGGILGMELYGNADYVSDAIEAVGYAFQYLQQSAQQYMYAINGGRGTPSGNPRDLDMVIDEISQNPQGWAASPPAVFTFQTLGSMFRAHVRDPGGATVSWNIEDIGVIGTDDTARQIFPFDFVNGILTEEDPDSVLTITGANALTLNETVGVDIGNTFIVKDYGVNYFTDNGEGPWTIRWKISATSITGTSNRWMAFTNNPLTILGEDNRIFVQCPQFFGGSAYYYVESKGYGQTTNSTTFSEAATPTYDRWLELILDIGGRSVTLNIYSDAYSTLVGTRSISTIHYPFTDPPDGFRYWFPVFTPGAGIGAGSDTLIDGFTSAQLGTRKLRTHTLTVTPASSLVDLDLDREGNIDQIYTGVMDLRMFTAMTDFDADGENDDNPSSVTAVNMAGLSSFVDMDYGQQAIDSEGLKGIEDMSSLVTVDLGNCNITHVPVFHATALANMTSLNLVDNNIPVYDFTGFTAPLTNLQIGDASCSTMPDISMFDDLLNLDIINTSIASMSFDRTALNGTPANFTGLSIYGNTLLTSLTLSNWGTDRCAIWAYNCNLPQAGVDAILAQWATHTAGSNLVYTRGSAVPSAAGLLNAVAIMFNSLTSHVYINLPVESWTPYTEVDGGGTITKASGIITVVDMTGDETGYVYEDQGAGAIGDDVWCTFKINVQGGTEGGRIYPVVFSNTLGSWETIIAADSHALGIRVEIVSTLSQGLQAQVVTWWEGTGADLSSVGNLNLNLDTDYWVVLRKHDDVGAFGSVSTQIFEDEFMSNNWSGFTAITLNERIDHRYVMNAVSHDTNEAADEISCTIEDFELYIE